MGEEYEKLKSAGFNDKEIVDYLSGAGFSPDEVSDWMGGQQAPAAPKPKKNRAQKLLENPVMDAASQINSGLIQGAATVIPGLADIAISAQSLPLRAGAFAAGLEPEHVGLRPYGELADATLKGLKKSGVVRRDEPKSGGVRALKRGAEYVGGAVVPMGIAGQTAKVMGKAGKTVPAMVKTMAQNPVRQSLAAATGGAVQGGLETEKRGGVVPALAGLLTSGVVAAGPVRSAKGLVKSGKQFFSKGNAEARALKEVSEATDNADLVTKLKNAPDDEFTHLRTTAEITESPGMAVLQKAAEPGTPSRLNQMGTRAREREAIRQALIDELAPSPEGGAAIQENILNRTRQRSADAAKRIGEASKNVRMKDALIGKPVTEEVAGQQIRGRLQAIKQPYEKRVTQAFGKIDPKNTTRLSRAPEFDEIVALKKTLFTDMSRPIHPEAKAVFQRFTKLTKLKDGTKVPRELSINEVQKLRSYAQQAANKTAADGHLESNKLVVNIMEKLDGMAERAGQAADDITPQQVEQWRGARKDFKEFAQTFREGPVGDATAKGAYSRPNVPDSGVPSKFFVKGKSGGERARAFIKAVGEPEEAEELLREHVMTQMRKFSQKGGGLDAEKMHKFIADHSEALEEFPKLQDDINELMHLQKTTDLMTTVQQNRIKRFDTSIAGKVLKADPDKLMSQVLSGKSPAKNMKQIVTYTGDKEFVRRATVDYMKLKTFDANHNFSPNAMKKFVETNEAALKEVFDADHLKTLKRVAADLESEASVAMLANRAARGGSNTAQNLTIGRWMRSGAARWGLTGASRTAGFLFEKLQNLAGNETMEVIFELSKDPKYAQKLLEAPTPKNINYLREPIEDAIRAVTTGSIAGSNE